VAKLVLLPRRLSTADGTLRPDGSVSTSNVKRRFRAHYDAALAAVLPENIGASSLPRSISSLSSRSTAQEASESEEEESEDELLRAVARPSQQHTTVGVPPPARPQQTPTEWAQMRDQQAPHGADSEVPRADQPGSAEIVIGAAGLNWNMA